MVVPPLRPGYIVGMREQCVVVYGVVLHDTPYRTGDAC